MRLTGSSTGLVYLLRGSEAGLSGSADGLFDLLRGREPCLGEESPGGELPAGNSVRGSVRVSAVVLIAYYMGLSAHLVVTSEALKSANAPEAGGKPE